MRLYNSGLNSELKLCHKIRGEFVEERPAALFVVLNEPGPEAVSREYALHDVEACGAVLVVQAEVDAPAAEHAFERVTDLKQRAGMDSLP